jgi:hypothetical protein
MRNILASLPLAALLVVAGCDQRRENMTIVPDRQGHAASADGQPQPTHGGPVATTGEMYHTLAPGETLSQVARKYNVDLGWLIKRNDIQDEKKVKAGMQLIVPSMQTAPAMPQGAAPAPASAPRKR